MAQAAAGRFGQRVEPLQITQAIELAASVLHRSHGLAAVHCGRRDPQKALALSEEIGQSRPARMGRVQAFQFLHRVDHRCRGGRCVEAGDAWTKSTSRRDGRPSHAIAVKVRAKATAGQTALKGKGERDPMTRRGIIGSRPFPSHLRL
jgi:hypothetical protein